MLVIWSGTLVAIAYILSRKRFNLFKQTYSRKEQIKRIGIYYTCIDELPI